MLISKRCASAAYRWCSLRAGSPQTPAAIRDPCWRARQPRRLLCPRQSGTAAHGPASLSARAPCYTMRHCSGSNRMRRGCASLSARSCTGQVINVAKVGTQCDFQIKMVWTQPLTVEQAFQHAYPVTTSCLLGRTCRKGWYKVFQQEAAPCQQCIKMPLSVISGSRSGTAAHAPAGLPAAVPCDNKARGCGSE